MGNRLPEENDVSERGRQGRTGLIQKNKIKKGKATYTQHLLSRNVLLFQGLHESDDVRSWLISCLGLVEGLDSGL